MIDLLYNTWLKPGSDSAITGILAFRMFARIPLEPMLGNLTMPVHAFYGATDWMTREILDRNIENRVLVPGSTCDTVEDSGH